MYRLREVLQDAPGAREGGECFKCGRVRLSSVVTVGVRTTAAGRRAHFNAVVRCGSVWACPVCALTIRAARARELEAAAAWHRGQGGALLMLTGTVRHAWSHELKATRRGVAKVWAKLTSGRAWQEWARDAGLVGWVRCLEVTHGANGWHPHVHALLFVAAGVDVPALRARLATRWQDAAARVLGEECRPTLDRGLDLRAAHAETYLAKLVLELTASATKVGRTHDSRTPLQIAADYARWGDVADLELWRTYVAGMKGARCMDWSRGRMDLRQLAGLRAERADEALVDEGEGEEVLGLVIPGEVWDAYRCRHGWAHAVLVAVERSEWDAVAILLAGGWPPGRRADPLAPP